MKVRLEVDVTPEEARAFFGLPNVEALQQNLVKEMEQRLRASVATSDPAELLRIWMPPSLKGFEEMGRMFWQTVGKAAPTGAPPAGAGTPPKGDSGA